MTGNGDRHQDEEEEEDEYIKRAKPDQLLQIFNKYASHERNGEKLMTPEDFVQRYLGFFENSDFNTETVRLLTSIADRDKDGYISYSEFAALEDLLCHPSALYRVAFQLFDVKGKGTVSFHEFVEVLSKTELYRKIPFNTESSFVQLYFGSNKQRSISYIEFSRFLRDFHDECTVESFRRADSEGTGFISRRAFKDIINARSHLLSKQVQSHLNEIASEVETGKGISFPYFMAFNYLLSNMEVVKRIHLHITKGDKMQEVTRKQFRFYAQVMSEMSPLEVDILLKLYTTIHHSRTMLYKDLKAIAPEQYFEQVSEIKKDVDPEGRGVSIQMAENLYRFSLGSIAGAVGATAVFPIDLVKTRMQNQRTGTVKGEILYTSYYDCFKKIMTQEGFLGFYRGLAPLLVGVAPEKAIKLTMNDFARDKFYDKNGNIPLYGEIISGGCAGMSQLIFTNPLEIVKIRLQVAGEVAGGSKVRALQVVRDLGFLGLYTGWRACLLRDIPFNAIYFTVYSKAKGKLADENGYNNPATLLLAGTIAGIPAPFLVTPADVIKTRIQVVARTGQTSYGGVIDATKKIFKEEGFVAFWKGAVARVLRSSPQFGVTLFTYELLQRVFYIDFGGFRPSGSEAKTPTATSSQEQKSPTADHIGGYSVVLPILTGIETKFGISLPKFSIPKAPPTKTD